MSGKTSLPLIVEIAFGAGPMDTGTLTWTDVSAWVQRSKNISASRGFDPETQEPIAGRGSLRLRNTDGRFTPGTTGPFGLVRNRLPIRIRVDYETLAASELLNSPIDLNEPAALNESTSEVLWTGLIDKLTMGYDDGVLPIVDATLVDRWARLKARKIGAERASKVLLSQAPAVVLPLTDAAGADRARDLVTGTDVLFSPVPEFGAAANPAGDDGDRVCTGPDPVTPPTASVGDLLGAGWWLTLTVSAWIHVDASATRALHIGGDGVTDGRLRLTITSGATITLTGDHVLSGAGTFTITAAITTGWHHIAARRTSGGVWSMWLDGQQIGTPQTSTITVAPTGITFTAPTGIAYLAVFASDLSATTIADQYHAIAFAWAGDTAAARADALRRITGGWLLTTQGVFTATMSRQTLDGGTVADLLRACAQAENGSLFIGRDGWPVLQSRGHRADVALAATIPAKVLSKEAQWELDDQQIWNSVQVDRMALGETVTTINRRDEASIENYDEVSRSFQLWLDTDAAAVDRANQEAIMWSEALPRSRSFAVDLMTCQETIPAATLLAVDVGSRIQISGLPSTAPPQTSSGWYVDAIEDTITQASWVRTFTVSPAIDFLILDDATFGGLDEFPLG